MKSLRSSPFIVSLAMTCLLAADQASAIPCLTGFLRDANGTAVVGGDLDFNLAASGTRIVTPGDNSDATGFYGVCVLPNFYDVAFSPPPGTRLQGKRLRNLDLSADPGLELDVVLDFGQVVSGLIHDFAGAPVFDVDIDVDYVSGGRLYTPGDNTDLTGAYRVVVPSGLHRLRFEPVRGSRLLGAEIDSVDVTVDAVVDVTLEAGFLLQGNIADDLGAPAADVDIDFRDALTGAKVYLANNSTNADGNYIVAVPSGEFELRFTPPRASSLVAVSRPGFVLAGDVNQDQVLSRGNRLVVNVSGLGGLALADADLDVKDATTGAKLFTPHDGADVAGSAVAVLPDGVYDLIIDPPPGANYAGAFLPGVAVNGDLTLSVVLDGAPRVTVSGRVVDESLVGVGAVVFSARLASTGEEIRLASDRTLITGAFALDLPPVALNLTMAPPVGSRLVGRRLPDIGVTQDTTLSDLVLSAGQLVAVTVTGDFGRPVPGTDLDFVNVETGVEIFTPRDNAGFDGQLTVAVPVGRYRVTATPPPGSGFAVHSLENVAVAADTSLVITMPVVIDNGGSVAVLPASPNPFRTTAVFEIRLAAPTTFDLVVYDLRGRMVRHLASEFRSEGEHAMTWDGRTDSGARLPTGIYFISLRTPLGDATRRITLMH